MAGSTTFSAYISFAGSDDGWLFSTGDGTAGDGEIKVTITSSVLEVKMHGNSGNKQAKQVNIVDNNRHWLAIVADTTLATANQLVVELDNSATGVTTTDELDLNSQLMGDGVPNVFCQDAGGSPTNDYPGFIDTVIVTDTADDATVRTSFYTYANYLLSTIGTQYGTSNVTVATNTPYAPMEVAGAGLSALDGTYFYAGMDNSKRLYLSGDLEAIGWDGVLWNIKDDMGTPIYTSADDVETPDLVTTWIAVNPSDLPVPTVTEGTPPAPTPIGGIYIYSGIADSKPFYEDGAGNQVIWDGSIWAIYDFGQSENVYTAANGSDFPWIIPADEWVPTAFGTPPAPSVTETAP